MTKHTILFLAANPSGTDPRALDREARSIREELQRSGSRDRFELVTRWAVEPLDLLRELRKLKPTVVHFSGHGNQRGLFFQAADGSAQMVPPAAIAETFGAAGTSVKVVVLSGCYSELAADTLLAHADCVVGTGSSIHDDAARSFAIGFYGALGEEESVAAACRHGTAAISLAGLSDAERPQLKIRHGLDVARHGLVAATPPAKPTPSYPDDAAKALSERLADARARRQKLREARVATGDLDREILDLRRQLREGGQLRAGDSLCEDRYLLVKPVGRGGFAVVWEAYDRLNEQRVAIKVLHSNLATDPLRRERFFRGARAMMKLTHPAVVRVLEPEGEDGGFHYFVMELVLGDNLRRAVLEGYLGKELALPLILRVGEAITEAHLKGMVHRDIKPSNILLDEECNPKLTDFDLVSAPDTTGGTRTGALGTLLYAAPECLDKPQEATTRADVYGLGMTAIFCLSERELTLSTLKNPDLAIAQLSCSSQLKAVLLQAVAWDPAERFTDAVALGNALREALDEPTDDPIAREARARQAEAYAAVAERARKAAEQRAAREVQTPEPPDDQIAHEARARQAEAYAAVAERARKAAARRTRARQSVGDRTARETEVRPAAVAKNAAPPGAGPLTTREAFQMGILTYRPDLSQFAISAIACLILIIIVILFTDGLKKNDLSWKGWIIYSLGMGIFGLASAASLYRGFRSRACARCDLVLDQHPLRFGSLPTATSAAITGDIEALTDLAERAEPWSSSDIWLCNGCQKVGIIEMPDVQRVLRGDGLEKLARKVRRVPP